MKLNIFLSLLLVTAFAFGLDFDSQYVTNEDYEYSDEYSDMFPDLTETVDSVPTVNKTLNAELIPASINININQNQDSFDYREIICDTDYIFEYQVIEKRETLADINNLPTYDKIVEIPFTDEEYEYQEDDCISYVGP